MGLFLPALLVWRKARQSITAHYGLFQRIKKKLDQINTHKPIVWVHVASAGEYLQAKSMIQIFIKNNYHIFVTVTSISGYNWLKREKNENLFFDFLPLDFLYNAKKILNLVKPACLIFVKTDIWPNILSQAKKYSIPTALICAPSRNAGSGIKKSFYQFLYSNFNAVFTVNAEGEKFYKRILNADTIIQTVGDSKYDIVHDRKKEKSIQLTGIKSNDICALLGSVWPEDLKVISDSVLRALEKYPHLKIIAAPHENDNKHVNELADIFQEYKPVLFSDLKSNNENSRQNKKQSFKLSNRVLIVDTIGDLFFLYENSNIAYVGGGFSTGIHNILEPCAMQNAVIFGPKYQKFPEAENLLSDGCVFTINNTAEFEQVFNDLILNKKIRTKKANAGYHFITRYKGASQKLYGQILKLIKRS